MLMHLFSEENNYEKVVPLPESAAGYLTPTFLSEIV